MVSARFIVALALISAVFLAIATALFFERGGENITGVSEMREFVLLPYPRFEDGGLTLERALSVRRSIRDYTDDPLTLDQLGQLLWAAYGVNNPVNGFKTCPSAGATYPLVIYVVVGEASVTMPDGSFLGSGSYRYDPHAHVLVRVREGDLRAELARAALDQEWVRDAPVNIVIAAVYERTTGRYGERGVRYVHMEVGHAGQNIYLQAASLGLGTVAVGAFHDSVVAEVVGMSAEERPLYIMPVGVPATAYSVSEEEVIAYIRARREALGLGG